MSTHNTDPDAESGTTASGGRHPVSIGHLVMGLVFACFLALWAVVQFTDISSHDLRFLWPVPWIAGGAVGMVALAIRDRRRLRDGRWDSRS
jgi:heme A synthase